MYGEMNASVIAGDLHAALKRLKKVAQEKRWSPGSGYVEVATYGDYLLTVTGANSTTTTRTSCRANVREHGSFLVPYAAFTRYVALMAQEERIDILVSDGYLVMQQPKNISRWCPPDNDVEFTVPDYNTDSRFIILSSDDSNILGGHLKAALKMKPEKVVLFSSFGGVGVRAHSKRVTFESPPYGNPGLYGEPGYYIALEIDPEVAEVLSQHMLQSKTRVRIWPREHNVIWSSDGTETIADAYIVKSTAPNHDLTSTGTVPVEVSAVAGLLRSIGSKKTRLGTSVTIHFGGEQIVLDTGKTKLELNNNSGTVPSEISVCAEDLYSALPSKKGTKVEIGPSTTHLMVKNGGNTYLIEGETHGHVPNRTETVSTAYAG